jgi:hypothetical protein
MVRVSRPFLILECVYHPNRFQFIGGYRLYHNIYNYKVYYNSFNRINSYNVIVISSGYNSMQVMHLILLGISCMTGFTSVAFLHIYGISSEDGVDMRNFTDIYTLHMWILGQTCSIVSFAVSLYLYAYYTKIHTDVMVLIPCLLLSMAFVELFAVLQQKGFLIIFMGIHCMLVLWMIVSFLTHFPLLWPMHIIHFIWGVHTVCMQFFHYWHAFIYDKCHGSDIVDTEAVTETHVLITTDIEL